MSRNHPTPEQLALDVEPLPAILQGRPRLDEHLHGEPLDVEYGPVFGADSEWSPGQTGAWFGGNPPADGFTKSATASSIAATRLEARNRKAAGDRSIYGHALNCGALSAMCGACILEQEGLNVQAQRSPLDADGPTVLGERRGTIVWTGGYPETEAS